MSLFKDGINDYISNDDYHANKTHESSSTLKLFLDDPKAYYNERVKGVQREGKHPNQNAFDFGSYVHAHVLEPELVDEEFAVFPGAMRRGSVWNEFKEKNEGKIILTCNQGTMANNMIMNLTEQKISIGKLGFEKEVDLMSFFSGGHAEETFATELHGIPVKVRTDYRKEYEDFGSINDLKTTTEKLYPNKDKFNLRTVEDICERFSYDVSAALYCDAIEKITGLKQDFYFTFMSKSTNHSCIFKASEEMLSRGRAKYMEAIRGIKEARETGVWYTNEIQEIA